LLERAQCPTTCLRKVLRLPLQTIYFWPRHCGCIRQLSLAPSERAACRPQVRSIRDHLHPFRLELMACFQDAERIIVLNQSIEKKMSVLTTPVFTVRLLGGRARSVTLLQLLDAVEDGTLVDLVRLAGPYRAPMRSILAALLVLRRRYGSLEAFGDDIWRLTAPDHEPAFFQSPVSPGANLERISLGDVGLAIVGVGHAYKGIEATDDPEPWLLELMTATGRPIARYAAGLRAGMLTACPTDGTLATEIRVLAEALSFEHAQDPKAHLPWVLARGKGKAPSTAELPQPILDAPRVCRLREVNGHWWVEYEGGEADALRCVAKGSAEIIEPIAAREVRSGANGTYVGALRLSKKPLDHVAVHEIVAGSAGKKRQVDPAAILKTAHSCSTLLVEGTAVANGKTLGYRAKTFPVGKRSRLRLGTPDAAAISADLLTAVSLACWCLRTALIEAGLVRKSESGKLYLEPFADAVLVDLDTAAGWHSTDLLFDLLDQDLGAVEQATRINRAMRTQALAAWERVESGLEPIALGRGASTLQRLMRAKLPVKEEAHGVAA
jgi:hypothetical protein